MASTYNYDLVESGYEATASGRASWTRTTITWDATATASAQVTFDCPDDPPPPPPCTNSDPAFPAGETGVREIPENEPSGTEVGSAVAANDRNNDTLTYSLSGTDASSFTISSAGQLSSAAVFDHEAKSSYSFTVSVRDGRNATCVADMATDATIGVTVNVRDVNEPPAFDVGDGPVDFTVTEDLGNTFTQQNVGAALTATDPDDGDSISSYTIVPVNAAPFTIDSTTGQIKTSSLVSYEAGTSYTVNVRAWDNHHTPSKNLTVNISVTNRNEPPPQLAKPSVSAVTTGTDPHTKLDVSWVDSDTTGRPDISQYHVRHKKTADSAWDTTNPIITTRSMTLESLEGDTSYDVQVRADNGEGWSPYSLTTSATTSAPPPTVTPPPPTVSITRHSSMPVPPEGVAEGAEAVFVVSASFHPRAQGEITVNILLEIPFGDHPLPDYEPLQRTVTLSPTASTAELRLRTEQDNDDETNGNIFARLQSGEGYIVHSTPSLAVAGIVVIDDELPGVPISPGASGSIVHENNDGTGAVTRKPVIWWYPPANAQVYELTIAPETCPPNATYIPLSCNTGTPVTVKNITGTSRELEASEYQTDTLYRVYIRAKDTTLNESEWAGPVFLYPTSEVPTPEVAAGGVVKFPEIATAPIFSYVPMTGSVGREQVRLRYTICLNTLPTTAVREDTITGAMNTWRTVEKRKNLDLMRISYVSPRPAGVAVRTSHSATLRT